MDAAAAARHISREGLAALEAELRVLETEGRPGRAMLSASRS